MATDSSDYFEINRINWNKRTELHIRSDFYQMEDFIQGHCTLQNVEKNLFPDLQGKDLLHLQCHFGQDSISLSRLGAHVTAVDISDRAIDYARKFAEQLQTETTFICCNLYDLPNHDDKTYDLIFTSYGTVGWLPDLKAWAELISTKLRKNGVFVMVDFHPVVWMFDDDFTEVAYDYFNRQAYIESEIGSYADKNASDKIDSVFWNHSLDEILQNLIDQGLQINHFKEYDYSPYNCFKGCEKIADGQFIIQKMGRKIPLLYSIQATKL